MSQVISDTHLARAYLMGARPPLASEPCPSADELWAALDPDLPSSKERYRVLNHCARCPSCAQDLQVTKSMLADQQSQQGQFQLDIRGYSQPKWSGLASRRSEPQNDSTTHRNAEPQAPKVMPLAPKQHRLGQFGIFGALAAAAALALMFFPRERQNPAAYRGGNDLVELSAATLQSGPPDVSQYQYTAQQFRWPAGPASAKQYTLSIVDTSFQARCSIEGLTRPQATITPENCPGFDPSKTFYWQVYTLHEGGEESRSSFVSQQPKRGS